MQHYGHVACLGLPNTRLHAYTSFRWYIKHDFTTRGQPRQLVFLGGINRVCIRESHASARPCLVTHWQLTVESELIINLSQINRKATSESILCIFIGWYVDEAAEERLDFSRVDVNRLLRSSIGRPMCLDYISSISIKVLLPSLSILCRFEILECCWVYVEQGLSRFSFSVN